MKPVRIGALAALISICALAADARAQKLKPAKPQPANLTQGLSVEYAYPSDVKTLRDAYVALGIGAESGAPLAGLDYSSGPGAPNALTSTREMPVAARIKGYLRFDAAGTYVLDFLSNDGLQVTLGGKEIVKHDQRTACASTGKVEVSVPEAGWYDLEALWFQRQGTSCLEMHWAPEGGSLATTPGSAFGYK